MPVVDQGRQTRQMKTANMIEQPGKASVGIRTLERRTEPLGGVR